MLAEWRKPSGVSREFTVTGPLARHRFHRPLARHR
jgi:hypothetical protein